jgi:2-polyprenyl-6-hydroxyphenyl methylase/3-demethylubiquinone-9 3-methyltransferase
MSRAKTDEAVSIASREFEWSEAGSVEAHRYLIPPCVQLLAGAGARKILDLGCGNGEVTGLLASKGFVVEGCDASASGLALARSSFPGVRFFQHDLANPLPEEHSGGYDAVVSLEVIEHLLMPRQLMSNALQALRPGGLFVLSTPFHGYWKNLALALTNKFDDHWHPLRDWGHIKFFSKQTLLQLFKESGFEISAWLPVGRIPIFACSMIVAGRKK